MNFTKFPKIENILKSAEKGYVPFGTYELAVKLDGANAGIIRTANSLVLHSRNTFLAEMFSEGSKENISSGLSGFVEHIRNNFSHVFERLQEGDHVYGEWLVPHTIPYPSSMYKKFYFFDPKYAHLADPELGIELIRQLGDITVSPNQDLYNDTLTFASEYLASTKAAHKTEGFIFKNKETGERFKLVLPEFKEENGIKFSGKTVGDGSVELNLIHKYPERSYEKILDKVKTLKETTVIEKKHIPAVLGMAWDDYMTEFFSNAVTKAKFPIVDTKRLKSEFDKRIRDVFIAEVDTGHRPAWFKEYTNEKD